MERKNLFRKLNFLITLAAFFVAAIFCGCDNLLSSAEIGAKEFAASSQPREGYGTISGVLSSYGTADKSRTAVPTVTTVVRYEVFAENSTARIEASVDDANRTFSIALPYGTWNVTANGLDSSGKVIATQKTQEFTISATNPNVSLNFTLGYSTNSVDGAGKIILFVQFGGLSEIKSVDYVLSKGDTKLTVKVGANELNSGEFIINHTVTDLGAYNLTINFYGEHSMLVYRIDQIVNVYANLLTDRFVGSAPYIKDDKIELTKPMLDEFQNTTLYVGGTDINGKPASDTNTGTQFDPLATLNRALELVSNSTLDASTEFRVFLKGDVGDGALLSLDKKLTIASADGTARTITGLGRTFTVASGAVLTVQDINFKNIGFTVEGTVDMDACTVDGGNSAGGVYVKENAILTMKGGEIKNCRSNMYGGGLCIQGTAELTGTNITGCSAENLGGAVYIANTGAFTMSGGEISGNTTKGDGDGVYVATGGTFTMNGAAKITKDNDVYISSGVVKIGDLSEDFVARITIPQDLYKNGTKIIHKDGGTITDDICEKFTVTPDASGVEYKLIPDGEYGVLKSMSDLIYVRGSGAGWYEDNGKGDIVGDDTKSGNLENPFKTIQKAIDTVLARNDGSEDYTIYVDGEVTLSEGDLSDAEEMASFVALDKTLKLTIKALSDTKKATLNADGTSMRVINAAPDDPANGGVLNLKLEKLVIKNGQHNTGRGGGIHFNFKNGSLEMSDCEIIDNKAKRGGGISVFGGTLTATNCKISNNSADNASDSGGGVYIGGTGKLELKNVEISGNTASGYGGGIYVANDSNFTMTGGIISDNKGSGVYLGNAAATFEMNGGEISNNTADNSGGGVYVNNGTFTLNGGAISGNTTSNDGGGIYVNNGTLTLDGTVKVIGNKSNGTNTNGGGVYFQNSSNMLTIGEGVTISGNSATNHGGGVYAYRGASTDTVVKIEGGEISGNTALYGGGVSASCGFEMSEGKISGNGEISGNDIKVSLGGGVYVHSSGKFTMTGGIIGGSADGDDNKAEKGGGVYVETSGSLTMAADAIIEKNTARTNGGGIFIEYGGTVTMNGGTISGNTADSGAGIYSAGGTIALLDGNAKVIDNHGAGICATGNADGSAGTRLDMINGEISGNKSNDESGGVLVNNKSTFTMSDGTISQNTTTKRGGGVYVGKNGTFEMKGGTISSNSAGTYGNGVYVTAESDGKGTFMMSGDAKVDTDNDVYLRFVDTQIPTIQVDGALAATSVATITPSAYAADTRILSAGTGVTIDQTICDKFSVTPQPDGTKWKIMPNSADNTGVLKKGDLSGGIEIVIPGLETYTFKVIVDDGGEKDIVEGMTLHSGKSVTLKEVTDSKGRTPSGTCTLQIRDSSGNPFPGAQATGTPTFSVSVPVIPPVGDMPAQVYVELTLDDGTVINKTVNVTISP